MTTTPSAAARRIRNFLSVIPAVLPRPSVIGPSRRSLAIFRFKREGTDPASRGTTAPQPAGASTPGTGPQRVVEYGVAA